MVGKNEMDEKRKFALYIKDSVLELARDLYDRDNCKSMSEFIEKAIVFYSGYLLAEQSQMYLPNVVTSTMKAIISESNNRISRLLFKLSVEQAMMMNILAASHDIDAVTLELLRGDCVKEVKRLNGAFSFDDALRWQKG